MKNVSNKMIVDRLREEDARNPESWRAKNGPSGHDVEEVWNDLREEMGHAGPSAHVRMRGDGHRMADARVDAVRSLWRSRK
tara:strand:+ start:4948 stop:5190 length:243 start_codon:yes stop_codon:yes gene_type:complete